MTIPVMRFLDRHLARFTCWCLAPVAGLCKLISRTGPAMPRRILVVKLSEMGSTVLATPALQRLKSLAPDAEIFMLVFKQNAPIVRILNLVPIENLFEIDISSVISVFASSWKALLAIRRLRIDTTIDMDIFMLISAVYAFLSGARTRVGFHRFADEGLDRGSLLTHRVVYSTEYHTTYAFISLVESLFADRPTAPNYRGILPPGAGLPSYMPAPDVLDRMKRRLTQRGIVPDFDNASIILVAPGSAVALPLRRWPLTSYTELCKRLLACADTVRILVIGGRDEMNDADRLVAGVGDEHCSSMAGETELDELLALCSLADVLIANDGGPAHFAAICGLPSVVMFGPETPRLYGPLGDKALCLYSKYACSPCLSAQNGKESTCDDNACMQAITIEQVLSATRSILGLPAEQEIRPPSM